MSPHDTDQPSLGLETLAPLPGGMDRLLAKRARRGHGRSLDIWLPAAACAASLFLLGWVLRGPSFDADAVRRQLSPQGKTLQIEAPQQLQLEQRAVTGGVHVYALRRR